MRLSSAPSIEETGLEAVVYGERQPHYTTAGANSNASREGLPSYKSAGPGSGGSGGGGGRPPRNGIRVVAEKGSENFHEALAAVRASDGVSANGKKAKHQDGHGGGDDGALPRGKSTSWMGKVENGRRTAENSHLQRTQGSEAGKKGSGESFAEVWERLTVKNGDNADYHNATTDPDVNLPETKEKGVQVGASNAVGNRLGSSRSDSVQRTASFNLKLDRLSGIDEGDLAEESATSTPRRADDHDDHEFADDGSHHHGVRV